MLSPGPDFVLIVKNSQTSLIKALGTSLGITLGLSIHLCLVIFGASKVLTALPYFNIIISLLGSFYLMRIAYLTYKSDTHNLEHFKAKRSSFFIGLKEGFICNILNPKLIIFLLSILSQYLKDISKMELTFLTYLTLLLECFIVWSLLGFLMQMKVIKAQFLKYETIFNKVFAIALCFFSFKIIGEVLAQIKFF